MIDREKKTYVAGHLGLVGSAILRSLESAGFRHLIYSPIEDLDLTNQDEVEAFFDSQRPSYVFLAAAKVGGILANATYPGDFIRENLQIQTNVLDAARRYEVEKLLFLGSSCIYPKHAEQPMREEALLTGPLEPTNSAYALAKIAGLEMCKAYWSQYGCRFVSLMPTNLYGPGDNFDLETSHVLPALIRKFHEAKEAGHDQVTVWGSGKPRREFLHVDDLADAALFVMDHHEDPQFLNVGTGQDIAIGDLASLVADVVGFQGEVVYDRSELDGTPRKLLDISRISALGWKPRIGLWEGIAATYEWFLRHEGG